MITLTPGTVAVIELDNGPLNLVDVSAMEQLHAALDRAQDALLATGAALYFGGFLLAIETALERLVY